MNTTRLRRYLMTLLGLDPTDRRSTTRTGNLRTDDVTRESL
ncbi:MULTISPECIES: hypothetical protein [Streptomyces]|nr:hypothetical protein [Streptomyces recifensis]